MPTGSKWLGSTAPPSQARKSMKSSSGNIGALIIKGSFKGDYMGYQTGSIRVL